jgi:hypothetical protein
MKLLRLIKMRLNEKYSKIRIGKHLSDGFAIQNGLKHGMLYNHCFQLYFRIRKVQENYVGLKLNGIDQPVANDDDDVNLLGNKIDTITTNAQTLIDARKEVGLEIHVEKVKCTLLSCYRDAGQNPDIKY